MTTPLQDAVAKLVTDAIALNALVSPGAPVPVGPIVPPVPPVTPPVTPPVVPPTSSSTFIVASPGSKQTLTDAAGHVYGFGGAMSDIAPMVWGYFETVDGVQGKGVVIALALVGGTVYGTNTLRQWSPSTPSPLPVLTSPDGTTITDVGSYLFDAAGNVFSYWNHLDPTYGAGVSINGSSSPQNYGFMKVVVYAGVAWGVDLQGRWQSYVGTAWVPQAKGPV